MRVLQGALAERRWWVHAQQPLKVLVPPCGHVVDLDLAFDQRLLNLHTHDDMQWVSQLVGRYADGAGPDAFQQPRQVVRLERGLRTEGLAQQWRQQLAEGGLWCQLALEDQSLAFMQCGRVGPCQRLAQPSPWQVLLVARMSRFVDRADQAGQEIGLVETRGHAHVFRHATGERVLRGVQAAGIEVEAQQGHHLFAQPFLRCGRKGANRRQRRRRVGLRNQGLFHKRRQPALNLPK